MYLFSSKFSEKNYEFIVFNVLFLSYNTIFICNNVGKDCKINVSGKVIDEFIFSNASIGAVREYIKI